MMMLYKRRQDEIMQVTAQVPSVKLQHKCMESGNAVETSLHLALGLRSHLLSTFMCT